MHKFNDDIPVHFLVMMKNVLISFIKNIERLFWGNPVTVIDDFITMKIILWQNLGRSFYIWGQIEAVFII